MHSWYLLYNNPNGMLNIHIIIKLAYSFMWNNSVETQLNPHAIMSAFNGPTTQKFAHARSMKKWTIGHCILKHINNDHAEIEVFEDSTTHQWMLGLNACVTQMIDMIMPRANVAIKCPYNEENNTLRLKISGAIRKKLLNRLPLQQYDDVDVIFCMNCAWASDNMKGISFGLFDIRQSISPAM